MIKSRLEGNVENCKQPCKAGDGGGRPRDEIEVVTTVHDICQKQLSQDLVALALFTSTQLSACFIGDEYLLVSDRNGDQTDFSDRRLEIMFQSKTSFHSKL